jgi:hypothetical protein
VYAAPSFGTKAVLDSFSNWQRAASSLDAPGALYRPTFRAGLKQDSRIDVLAFEKKTKSGTSAKYSSMLITGSYKNRLKAFTVMEKYANTKWAARRVADPEQRIVSKPKLKINQDASKIRATIYANCAVVEPKPEISSQENTRCSKRDVKRFGGLLVMKTPAGTSIVIESRGLSYRELVGIARGLKQINVD